MCGHSSASTQFNEVTPLPAWPRQVTAFHEAHAAAFTGAKVAMQKRVLQISDDPGLTNTRRLILLRAGFLADLLTPKQFWARTAPLDCDVLVLCQTVSPGEAKAIALSLQLDVYAPPVVRLSIREELEPDTFNTLLHAPTLPSDFCAALERTLAVA